MLNQLALAMLLVSAAGIPPPLTEEPAPREPEPFDPPRRRQPTTPPTTPSARHRPLSPAAQAIVDDLRAKRTARKLASHRPKE